MTTDQITLSIDGTRVSATPGMTVLEAAQAGGIYIPSLCADPDLKPYGGCRLCVVEIDKMRGLPTACTTPAAEGMVVRTESPALSEARRTVVDLLLAEHPGDCLTCVKNQRCDLQKVAAYLGVDSRRFPASPRRYEIDDSNPFFRLDRNYCILCGKCVRTCDEVAGMNAIEMVDRGYQSHVATFGDRKLMESTCNSCGECVARCPVAALTPKESIVPGKEVASICPYCGVGCGIVLGVREGRVISVRGDRGNPSSKGRLCVKGRFGISGFINSADRLTKPLIRKEGQLTEASWDEALDLVASHLKNYKPDEVAVITSAKCSNEENYLLQKLARAVLGSNNVDHCARLCHAPTVAGLAQSFGSGAMTNSIADLSQSKCFFVIGSNTTETHPVIGFEVKKAVKGGARLIIANPREIPLVRYADIWLRQRPGSDVALLSAMARIIIDENLFDADFVSQRCESFDDFRESLASFDLANAAAITGVPLEDIKKAARLYASSSPAAILYAMGITQHSHGTDNVIATANLALLTGNVGKPGAGVNPLRGQNNVQGACDMGALPNVFPGYQPVADAAIRQKFETAWGTTLPDRPGLTLTQMIAAGGEGRLKAMYLVGENALLSEPDAGHARAAMEKLDFLVVQDIFLSETAELADVVLPAAAFAEKDGTFTNTERRVQRFRQAVAPPGEARADWRIVCDVAQRMGASGFDYDNPAQIMAEIAGLTPSYGGISCERLENGGLQWPCPDAGHPGTPVLHTQRFTRGKGRFIPLAYRPPAEMPDAAYPLLLTTGRSLFQFHTGTMTRRSKGLDRFLGEEMVEMNPADAIALGIADSDPVRVQSRRGEVHAHARITPRSPQGVVFMTFHFAESRTNLLTNAALDPQSGIPEYKVCAVRVSRLEPAKT